MLQSLGKGEGEVDMIVWSGYAEDGSTDPDVDWVTPFEEETGCIVTTQDMTDSNNGVSLIQSGEYDGISASGDATTRLIASGLAAPINTDVFENYEAVFDSLKDLPHNTVDGVNYGVPHGRGANLLMWRTDKVKPAPDSWSVVWDENSPNKGKVTAYDSPIYIADAALYLKATQPDLGIDNVYELDDEQFQAAVDLLKQQREIIGEYWSDYTKEMAAFSGKNSVIGTTWQVIANLLAADKVDRAAVDERENPRARFPPLRDEARRRPPHGQEGLLHRILRKGRVADDADREAIRNGAEAVVELGKRAVVSSREECDEGFVREVGEVTVLSGAYAHGGSAQR